MGLARQFFFARPFLRCYITHRRHGMLAPLIGLGWTEILVVAGVIFVFFGAQRIPGAFRALGEGINSFKEGLEGGKSSSEGERALPEQSSGSDGNQSSSHS